MVDLIVGAIVGGSFGGTTALVLLFLIARRANSMQSVVRPPDAGSDLNPARSPDRHALAERAIWVMNDSTLPDDCGYDASYRAGWLARSLTLKLEAEGRLGPKGTEPHPAVE